MFSLIAAIAKPVTALLAPLAYKAGKFLKNAFFDSKDTSALTYRVKEDERYQGALLEYVRAKDIRERELMQLNAAQLERANELKEQELKDRRELSALQRELMRELQAKEIEVKLTEIQTLWDKDTWFSKLSRQETEQILLQQQHRLLILLSPPEISEDCPASFRNNLRTEMRSVGAFLNEHYSPQDSLSPVKFYSDYFNQPIADIDVERLQRILSPVPTIILYSDISDYAVTFRIGFWGVGNPEATVFSTKPWNWEEAYELLLEAGKSETQSFRIIRRLIVSIHNLLATFWADSYYLQLDPHYEPKLFSLSDELVGEGLAEEVIQPYLEALTELKKQRLEAYQRELEKIAQLEESKINDQATPSQQNSFSSQKEESTLLEKIKTKKVSVEKYAQSFVLSHQLCIGNNGIYTLAFSHQKNILVSGTSAGSIHLIDAQKGEVVALLRQRDSTISSVAISPDNQLVASAGSRSIIELAQLTESNTNQFVKILTGHSNESRSVTFNPNGELLASGGLDRTIKLWDVNTGELIYTISGFSDTVYSVAFSPDGQILAGGCRDKTIKLFKVSNGEFIYRLIGHGNVVRTVQFSPDGRLLATGSFDTNVRLWDVETGQALYTLRDHLGGVESVAFSSNGQILASGSADQTVKLWQVDTGKLLRTLSCGRVPSIAFSSDGLTLAAGCLDGLIYIWRCEVGEE